MSTRPKILLYADDLAAVERRIVDALPEIVDGLIAKAREGDTKAAVYLCDRILGRVAGAKLPPADDRRAPYNDDDFKHDDEERREREDLFLRLRMNGARSGV